MSKVICDVCGTTFPETAAQCPICGSAKTASAQTAAGSSQHDGENTTAYTYVKGGRFSKSNVRKRNGRSTAPQRYSSQERQPQRKSGGNHEEPANRALIVVVILLLLAIIAVVIYIAVRVIGPTTVPEANTKPTQTEATQYPTLGTPDIPCTALNISQFIELKEIGDTWLIQVDKEPADTTDKVTYETADMSIATVSDAGLVEAVSDGQTVITVKCGTFAKTCTVIVGEGSSADQPTDDPNEPVDPDFTLELNRKDFTLSKYGETWRLYTGSVSPLEITWITDDPEVCTINNGVVTAVGPGNTKVHAQYNGQTVTCIVYCSASVVPPTGDPSIEIKPSNDVTIKVGESFNLTLIKKGAEGESDQLLTVTWTASEDGIVTIDGNKITGSSASAATGIKVSTTYEGNTYECIVRVTEKTTTPEA